LTVVDKRGVFVRGGGLMMMTFVTMLVLHVVDVADIGFFAFWREKIAVPVGPSDHQAKST
jgi:hypothetical protein